MSGLDLTTKVKVLTLAPKQTLLRVQSRGMQGPTGTVTPELLAARDAAQQAATDAGVAAGTATTKAGEALGSASAADGSAQAAAGSALAAAGSASAASGSADAALGARVAAEAVAPALNARMDTIQLAATQAGILGYATKSAMDADLVPADGKLALVTNDATAANNGTYRKTGASGTGSWVLSADRVTAMDAKIAEVEGTLYADVQRIGYADGAIPNGTTAATGASYTFTTPVSEATSRIRFACYARAAGIVYVQVVSRAGDTNTVVAEAAVPVGIGYNEATVNLPCSAGQYVGFRAASGIVAIASGSPGYSYWSGPGITGPGGSYVDAVVSTIVFHARFYLGRQTATGDSVSAIGQGFAALSGVVGDESNETYWIGGHGAATPVTGSSIGSNTYVAGTPVPMRSRAVRVRAYILAPGAVTLRKFAKTGDTFAAVGDDLVVTFTETGVVEVPITDAFVLAEGEFYGITKSSFIVSVDTAAAPDGYYVGGADATSFTDTSPAVTYTIQLSVEFEADTVLSRLSRLEAATEPTPDNPDGYIVVWGLGESHMAGRGESPSSVTLPVGAAYKYARATGTIEHMADPTGADAAANGSFGPALADAVWRMSNGTLGVIFVNSGFGSSRIGVGWASGGTGWTQALADWTDAIAEIAALKLPVAGVGVLLAIGSNDAAVSLSSADFKTATLDLLARCRTTIGGGDSVPLVLMQTGDFTDGSYAAEVQIIRQAQAELVKDSAGIFMGWTGAKGFVSRGLMRDNVHYKQIGNDIAGRGIGGAILARSVGRYPSGLD